LTRLIFGTEVHGVEIGAKTECAHWHSERDVIAIKFACCDTFYPCFTCHSELAGHRSQVWEPEQFDEKAIFCGACGHQLSISEYFLCRSRCPDCGAEFNPGCRAHWNLYFRI